METKKKIVIFTMVFAAGLAMIWLANAQGQTEDLRNEISVPMQQTDVGIVVSAYANTMQRYMDQVEKNNEMLSAQMIETNIKLDLLLKKIERIERALKIEQAEPAAQKTSEKTPDQTEKKSEPKKADKKDI